MKKTLILITMLLPIVLLAQRYPTGKGTFRTGGGGSYSQSDKGDYNLYKLTITPRLGYFVTDYLSLGFQMNYSISYDTNYTSALKFTPQVKAYYPINDHWFIIGNFEVGVDRTTVFADNKSITDHTSISFGPGVSYFYNRRIGFEVNPLYQIYINPEENYTNRFTVEGGIVFNILNKSERNKANRKKNVEYDELEDE